LIILYSGCKIWFLLFIKKIVSASFSQIKVSICYLIFDFTQLIIFLVKSEYFIFVHHLKHIFTPIPMHPPFCQCDEN